MCKPCPGTPGSDCSRCDQVESVQPDRYKRAGVPQFLAPCKGCEGVDWNGYSVRDVVRIPVDVKLFNLEFRAFDQRSVSQFLNLTVYLPHRRTSSRAGTSSAFGTTARPPHKSGATAPT